MQWVIQFVVLSSISRFSAFQIFFGVGSMVLGVACTAHQSLMMNVSPDFWSLNGFIGTGIWSGAYLIILSYIQIRAVEKQRVPSFLLSFFLAAVGVLDLLTVIILSIFSAFVTNQPCTLEEYQRRAICKVRFWSFVELLRCLIHQGVPVLGLLKYTDQWLPSMPGRLIRSMFYIWG